MKIELDCEKDTKSQIHSLISTLYNEYKTGNHLNHLPDKRVKNSHDIIEAYFKCHEETPPSVILERLSNYILIDHISDSNPYKSREKNAFQSKTQRNYVRKKESLNSNIQFNQANAVGKKATYVDNQKSNAFIFDKDVDEILNLELSILLELVIIEAKLTERQTYILRGIMIEDKLQKTVAAELNISRQAVTNALKEILTLLEKTEMWNQIKGYYY